MSAKKAKHAGRLLGEVKVTKSASGEYLLVLSNSSGTKILAAGCSSLAAGKRAANAIMGLNWLVTK